MSIFTRTVMGRTLAIGLSLGLSQAVLPAAAVAEETHLVTSQTQVDRLLDNAKDRDAKVALFESALATPEAEHQAQKMGLDIGKLRAGVPHRTDQELKDITARIHNSKDITAGYYGDHGLVTMAVLLIVLAAVILIVAADSR